MADGISEVWVFPRMNFLTRFPHLAPAAHAKTPLSFPLPAPSPTVHEPASPSLLEKCGRASCEAALLNPSLADFYHTNTVSHQCPYTEHAHFNQIEYAMNC